jgi:hypothetical protein
MSTLMSGDIEKVHEYLRAGKAVIQELGSSWVGLHILMMEGRLLAITGDLDRAESIYREANHGFQEFGEPTKTNITRSELAHTLRRQGKWEQALPLYRETIFIFGIGVTNLRSQTSSNASPISPSHKKSRKKQAGYWGQPRRSESG